MSFTDGAVATPGRSRRRLVVAGLILITAAAATLLVWTFLVWWSRAADRTSIVHLPPGTEVSADSLLVEFRGDVSTDERERIIHRHTAGITTGRGAEAAAFYGVYAIKFRPLSSANLIALRDRLLEEPGIKSVEYNVIGGF